MTVSFKLDTAELKRYLAERRDRLAEAVEFAGETVMQEVMREAQALAAARIEHPRVFGGYLDEFEIRTERRSGEIRIALVNTAPHAPYVEEGRPAGQPVEKAYVDNEENRRRGRVGASYVSHYTGMPPANIFGDNRPDWAPRFAIARDGFPGRHIFRDIRARHTAEELADRIGRLAAADLARR